jgi:hypothetical protein
MSPAGLAPLPHPTHLEGYIVQGLKTSKEARQVLVWRLGHRCESEFAARRSPTEQTAFAVSPTDPVQYTLDRVVELDSHTEPTA